MKNLNEFINESTNIKESFSETDMRSFVMAQFNPSIWNGRLNSDDALIVLAEVIKEISAKNIDNIVDKIEYHGNELVLAGETLIKFPKNAESIESICATCGYVVFPAVLALFGVKIKSEYSKFFANNKELKLYTKHYDYYASPEEIGGVIFDLM